MEAEEESEERESKNGDVGRAGSREGGRSGTWATVLCRTSLPFVTRESYALPSNLQVARSGGWSFVGAGFLLSPASSNDVMAIHINGLSVGRRLLVFDM